MITERQKAFRQEYRSRIVGWYDGYVHILIIYAMGAAAFYIYVAHIHNVTWLEWLTLPLTFLFTNIFEWAVHRFIMHRPVNIKGLRAIYERHTLNHHQFFTDEEMRFRDPKDWRVTVFPPYALVVFILMSIPMAVVLGLLLTPNVGWLFMCVTTGMYLIYEFMHFCCHVDENWFVRHCPFVNTLRRHHTAHHNARLMMEVNMNLTFPIADWLFGTSDLRSRGDRTPVQWLRYTVPEEKPARGAEAAGSSRRNPGRKFLMRLAVTLVAIKQGSQSYAE